MSSCLTAPAVQEVTLNAKERPGVVSLDESVAREGLDGIDIMMELFDYARKDYLSSCTRRC